MIPLLVADLAALAGAITAILAVRDARRVRAAADHQGRMLASAKRWAETQEIFIACLEDELYQTRRILGARFGELTTDAASRRMNERRTSKEVS